MFPVSGGGRRIEQAGFLEGLKCVGVKDFGPEVAVVACGITAREDVGKISASVSWNDLLDQIDIGHGYFLETPWLNRLDRSHRVIGHVEITGSHVLDCGETLIEFCRRRDLFDDFLGNGLARLVMARIHS